MIKVHPPASAQSAITVNGRPYNPAAGVQDVPDGDAYVLMANGWLSAASGATNSQSGADVNSRPKNPVLRQVYLDNALGIKEIWDGKAWRNALTGTIVP